MSATDVIDRLMTLHPKGFDLSLGRIARLMERLGDPHLRLPPVIHIAGTNGKGSASAYCRALLEAQGLTVHVHTSPHLVAWAERFRIGRTGGGQLIDDAVFEAALLEVEAANAGEAITVFELLTAVMFLVFSRAPADAAIVEVGLGGRFDATNIIPCPAASLVMPVAFDHMQYLGDTVEKIAFEKAGILKRGVPAVIGTQPFDGARDALVEQAGRAGATPLTIYGQDYHAHEEHGRMVYQDEDMLLDLPLPALVGRHQIANAAAALRTVKAAGFRLDQDIAERGLKTVSWPARMQRLAEGALVARAPEGSEIWLDGGHNPHAGLAISEAIAAMEERQPRPLFLIAGMINTKDPRGYFEAFDGLVRHVFTVPVPSSEAGIDPADLAAFARSAGLSAEAAPSVGHVLDLLRTGWNRLEVSPRILIGGSLYLAGTVLEANGTPPD